MDDTPNEVRNETPGDKDLNTVAKKRKLENSQSEATKVNDEERTVVKRKKRKKKKRKKFKPPSKKSRFTEKEYETEIDYLKDVLAEKNLEMENLKRMISEAEERVEGYNEEDSNLNQLCEKWKEACEEIVREIHKEMVKKFPDKEIKDIVQHFNIPTNVLLYDEDDDEFKFFFEKN